MENKKIGFIVFVFACFLFFGLSYVRAVAQTTPQSPEKVEYTAEDLEDPFKEEEVVIEAPPVETPPEKKPLPELKIQGIIWGGIFPQAIINNKIIKKGDVIDEARVVDINKDGVVLLYQGEEYKLPSPALENLKKPKKKSGGSEGGKQ